MARSKRNSEQTLYSLVIGGSTSAPTPGNVEINKASYSYLGDKLLIEFSWKQSTAGSAGSGTYLFPLPPGFIIDHDLVTFVGDGGYSNIGCIGVGHMLAGAETTIAVVAYDATNLALLNQDAGLIGSGAGSIGSNADLRYFFTAFVPVL